MGTVQLYLNRFDLVTQRFELVQLINQGLSIRLSPFNSLLITDFRGYIRFFSRLQGKHIVLKLLATPL